MRRISVLQPKVLKFKNDIVDYTNLLHDGKRREAAQLRSALNIEWGSLESDLTELGIKRVYRQFGQTFPIFESALQSPEGRFSGAPFDALNMAAGELETIIGKLEHLREVGSPIRHSFWISGFVLTFIMGWLMRHYQTQLLLLRRLPAVTTWADKKVFLSAIAVCVSGANVNFFSNAVQTDDWIGSIRRHPVKIFVYIFLSLGSLVYLGKLAASP